VDSEPMMHNRCGPATGVTSFLKRFLMKVNISNFLSGLPGS